MASSKAAEIPVNGSAGSMNYGAPRTRLIAGVSVADNPLVGTVFEYAQRLSEPYLFNHAMRSWLFAETIGRINVHQRRGPLGSPCTANLGLGCAQLDAIACAPQGAGGGGGHAG